MLKVLHLSAPTSLAGAERVILNYLEHLNGDAFSLSIASMLNHHKLSNSFTEVLATMDVESFQIPIGNTSLLWQIREVARIIRKNRIDIIHTHGYRADVTGFIASRFAGVPAVATVHGWTPISVKLRVYEKLDRYFLKWFNTVQCVSRQLYDELMILTSDKEKLLYVANAVKLPPKTSMAEKRAARNELNIHEDGHIVLFVGRLSPEKGLDLLLQAFARVSRNDDTIRLVIAGDGPQKDQLKALAYRLGVEKLVTFTGFMRDVSKLYAAADLFVLSSHTEGLPMVLLEAMAAGLPVVATAVGGIPDVIHDGDNGFLVPPGDVDTLSSAIATTVADATLNSYLASNARKTVELQYSVETWARNIEGMYERVASHVGRGGLDG